MQIQPVAAAVFGAALLTCGVAARADDAAQALAQNLGKGMAAASSFVATLDATHGIAATLTFNRGGLVAMTGAMGPMKYDMIHDPATKTSYMRFNGGAWMYRTSEGAAGPLGDVSAYTGDYKGANLTVLPDTVENGKTFGAFSTAGKPPSGPVGDRAHGDGKMVCTYDKASYRLHACTFGEGATPTTLTYSQWNDPANAIALPKDAQPFSPGAMMRGLGK